MYFFSFFLVVSVLLAVLMLFSIFFGSLVYSIFLFSLDGIELSFSFVFDYVSLGFFCAVTFVSSMVYFYSVFYMAGTVGGRRFYWLVFGFVASMGLLVFSGNLLTLMIGWDGLGLISFCLVIFYSNYPSLESGLVTVFSNRIGDVFFLGCFLFTFCDLSGSVLMYSFLFLGAITKSAQFPFSAWLPAAMAAPTPVSSLVHSSTLVTAGVYVLLRYWHMFSWLCFLKVFFIATMLLAGMCACLETDFKKIVAMSTLSQLGMMLFILSVGVWSLTFLHMIIHAFFKSLLFMSTGSLMGNAMGGQDSRIFGSDSVSFGTFIPFFVSSACLMGFPFYLGFYSKDFIILSSSLSLGLCYYFTFLSGCFLTVCYSIRLLKVSFSGLLSGLSQQNYKDSKIFLMSICFLVMKSWILGLCFFCLFFFDSEMMYLGYDLIVGLFLISLALSTKVGFGYVQSVFLYHLGYLRWLFVANSMLSNKIFRWDSGWLELAGGQGVYVFLLTFSKFDKILGLGLSLLVFIVIL